MSASNRPLVGSLAWPGTCINPDRCCPGQPVLGGVTCLGARRNPGFGRFGPAPADEVSRHAVPFPRTRGTAFHVEVCRGRRPWRRPKNRNQWWHTFCVRRMYATTGYHLVRTLPSRDHGRARIRATGPSAAPRNSPTDLSPQPVLDRTDSDLARQV